MGVQEYEQKGGKHKSRPGGVCEYIGILPGRGAVMGLGTGTQPKSREPPGVLVLLFLAQILIKIVLKILFGRKVRAARATVFISF